MLIELLDHPSAKNIESLEHIVFFEKTQELSKEVLGLSSKTSKRNSLMGNLQPEKSRFFSDEKVKENSF